MITYITSMPQRGLLQYQIQEAPLCHKDYRFSLGNADENGILMEAKPGSVVRRVGSP